jgi:hypothetical protein
MVDARVDGRWFYLRILFIIAVSVHRLLFTAWKGKKGMDRGH